MNTMSNTGKEIASRLGIAAKATFGIWGDAPDKYRAAIDYIQAQRTPSSAAMSDLKKAIKRRRSEAAQAKNPQTKEMLEDDAGGLQNVLDYAQRGDHGTLLRSAYNLDTEVRDDIPIEMFIWAGADVNWSHRNAKSLLDTVSQLVSRSKHGKVNASRAGKKAEMARPTQEHQNLINEYRALDQGIARLYDRVGEMISKSDAILEHFPKDERNPDPVAIAKSMAMIKALRSEMNAMLARHKFSRPGEKSEMAKIDGSVTSVALANPYLASVPLILKDGRHVTATRKDGRWSIAEMPEVPARRATTIYSFVEQLNREGFSRADEKAHMANHIRTVAEDKESKRAYLRRMIDKLDGELESLNNQPSLAGRVPAMDRIKTKIKELEAQLKSISSRPGAKTKMGRAEDVYRKLSNGSVTYANAKEMEKLASEALRMPDFTPAGTDWSLHELAEEIGQEALALKSRASRPGAKAEMAMTDVQRKAGYKWRVAYTKQLGKDQYLGGPPVTIEDDLLFATESAARQWADAMLKKGWFKGQGGGPEKVMKATVLMASRPGAKATAAKPELEETEEQKAGLKLMAASDEAVSNKIRTLIAEGKPQDQAVAIALDMKRRGEI